MLHNRYKELCKLILMKRLQIMIEEELDEALEQQARKERVSKAALIRRYVRERLRPLPPIEEDPLWDLVGMVESDDEFGSMSVDEVVYDLEDRT
jgi:hypothetical protein